MHVHVVLYINVHVLGHFGIWGKETSTSRRLHLQKYFTDPRVGHARFGLTCTITASLEQKGFIHCIFYKLWGTVQILTNDDKGLCYKIKVKYFRHTIHVSNGMLIQIPMSFD